MISPELTLKHRRSAHVGETALAILWTACTRRETFWTASASDHFSGKCRLTAIHLQRISWGSAMATSPALGSQVPDAHSSSHTQPPALNARDQTPTRRLTASPTFTSIEINENRGDCDVGAYILVSSFCSLMWIAWGRTGRSLRCAPASTNTASTPLARTLRICACDRSLWNSPLKVVHQLG